MSVLSSRILLNAEEKSRLRDQFTIFVISEGRGCPTQVYTESSFTCKSANLIRKFCELVYKMPEKLAKDQYLKDR